MTGDHQSADRVPRPITSGDKPTLDKRIVEVLANQVYCMDLQPEAGHRIWAYRRAAWAIQDTPQDLGLIHRQTGLKGLESIQNAGPRLAPVVERLFRGWMSG